VPREWLLFSPSEKCLKGGEGTLVDVYLLVDPSYTLDNGLGGDYFSYVNFCISSPGYTIGVCVGAKLYFTVRMPVDIDIKPGSDPNSINLQSQGTIPVAILSVPGFDAPSQMDKTSLTFGRIGDEASLAFCNKSPKDINGDGLLDQVCHFETQKTGFMVGDSEGILKGETVDGMPIKGRDSVKIVN